MTSGISKDIQYRVCTLFLCLQITRSDIRPHVKWAVSLVPAKSHLIFLRCLRVYVWVILTDLLYHTRKGTIQSESASSAQVDCSSRHAVQSCQRVTVVMLFYAAYLSTRTRKFALSYFIRMCAILNHQKVSHFIYLVQVRLGKKYYVAPQVQPDHDSPDHDSTFHITETPAQTTEPSVTSQRKSK